MFEWLLLLHCCCAVDDDLSMMMRVRLFILRHCGASIYVCMYIRAPVSYVPRPCRQMPAIFIVENDPVVP